MDLVDGDSLQLTGNMEVVQNSYLPHTMGTLEHEQKKKVENHRVMEGNWISTALRNIYSYQK